ncbi:TolC family outer membrane protein [Wenzhouxiangella marina]|uniref:Type I secretion protein TolC n=1 Tax=Wenzhouxiangella marina TaxID=1579979 RepID=A0A0K0XTS7_9GAMM|nr:TolC family outer membrane protein [Wenzhouxiangella marina]AKS41026.1 type I secretion protein TolC [Wenzhouxiangella marina]MBB6087904.1 outer membrane protein [Wenzhouxiangella marina]
MKKTILAVGICLSLSPLAEAVDLMGVYELAQAHDAELRAAEQRLRAAGEGPVQARAALLPSLSASASRTLGESQVEIAGTKLDAEDTDDESYSISLRQSIYDDANYGRLDAARAQYTVAQAQYAQAWQDFLLRVSERYFEVLTSLDSVRFARAEETALRRQFEQAEQRFEVGLAAVTDVHEARAVYDAAQARVILAENAVEDAREALREITGTLFEEYARLINEVPLEIPEPASAADWVAIAMETSPQILQQIGQLDSAQADLRVARAGHLPTLGLTGGYTRRVDNEWVGRDPITQEALASAELQVDGWSVGLELSVPLFQGFAVQSQRRQAGYNLRAADQTLDQTERLVVRQTENAFRAIVAGMREVQARQQALISAQSALEATNAGFEVGTRTIVDVLQAEQRFFQAERDYSQARHQFILNQLRLKQVAGQLAEDELVRVNQLLH